MKRPHYERGMQIEYNAQTHIITVACGSPPRP
jgi:hypothetical protein